MKLKKSEDGQPVFDDDKPVYILDDGRDRPIDVPRLYEDVKRMSEDRDKAMNDHKAIQRQMDAYKGIDPKDAREAIAFRSVIGEDADASKIQHTVASLTAENEGLKSQLDTVTGELGETRDEIESLTVGQAFRTSKWIREKMARSYREHPEHAQKIYGHHFKPENGGVVGYVGEQPIYSRKDPSKVADFDEAMSILVGDDKSLLASTKARGVNDGPGPKLPAVPKDKPWKEMKRGEKLAYEAEHGHEATRAKIKQEIGA